MGWLFQNLANNGMSLSKEKFNWNVRVWYYLHCTIDENEYNSICQCESAKNISRLLDITHEGTNQVKVSKINILVYIYELCFMKDNDTIIDICSRFTNIINGLQSLGKVYKE